jgi:tRNA (mo5U34)-methyltransferase
MSAQELRDRVSALKWWHSMDLGQGVRTPGHIDTSKWVERMHMPPRLDGKTVLDVGAWDGFYSFEAERRGAARVLATDSFSWHGPGWGTKDGFELARSALGSQVEDMDIDVLDLSPDKVGTFDVVLFLGVLYHMRDPLLALERVRSVTHGQLILETTVGMLTRRRAAAAFFPGRELDRDISNWWAPNIAALEGMLRAVGFARTGVAWGPLPLPRRVASAALRKVRQGESFLQGAGLSRAVVHAWT